MRQLTEEETRAVFAKLAAYCGDSVKRLIAPLKASARGSDRFVFRMIRDKVFYVRLSVANLAVSVARGRLLSLGTLVGKFTKSGKFKLGVSALPVLAEHARFKLWVKPNGEMPFLYGNNVLKAHIGRWSDDCPEHQGIVVQSMNDVPLGFGVTAKSTAEARRLDPTGIACFRQADCGEYLRDEDTMFVSG